MRWIGLLTLLLAFRVGLPPALAGAAFARSHTAARLVLSHDVVRPGDTFTVGIHLRMDPGWHTYWRNPGESGGETKVKWSLPEGVSAGPLLWPVPETYSSQSIVTYVYRGEVVLLAPITVAATFTGSTLPLAADVDWLECEELCLPGEAQVSATLTIADTARLAADNALVERFRARLPLPSVDPRPVAGWEGPPGTNDVRSLIVEWPVTQTLSPVEFLSYKYDPFEVSPASELLSPGPGVARLRLKIRRFEGPWPSEIVGVLRSASSDPPNSPPPREVVLRPPPEDLEIASAPDPNAVPSVGEELSLPKMLWFGFLGGLILNIMPCVFPVIALKILGFVNQSKENPSAVFHHGLVYAAGVGASFLVMAGLIIALKAGGQSASWGMQMQNPQFTLVLTVLVTLVALNLFGLFEVNLGGGVLTAASQVAGRGGYSGSFFNGVLATVLATPCTAPFLAPALGFAFAQSAAVIVTVFLAVALGLASPYLVLSWRPAWLRFLPRPGAWMEHFKVAMGFPMLATAVWVFSFTADRFGEEGSLWVGILLVLLALTAWIWGQFVQRGRRRRGVAMAICLTLLGLAYFGVLEGQLHWRHPAKAAPAGGRAGLGPTVPGGIDWRPWSADAVARARAEGRPVLVDFTARWCLTCKANKKTSIEIADVREKLKTLNAVALLGDFTDKDPLIAAELERHGRAGVPLVLVYPKDSTRRPQILPALLTPGIVLTALDAAGR